MTNHLSKPFTDWTSKKSYKYHMKMFMTRKSWEVRLSRKLSRRTDYAHAYTRQEAVSYCIKKNIIFRSLIGFSKAVKFSAFALTKLDSANYGYHIDHGASCPLDNVTWTKNWLPKWVYRIKKNTSNIHPRSWVVHFAAIWRMMNALVPLKAVWVVIRQLGPPWSRYNGDINKSKNFWS